MNRLTKLGMWISASCAILVSACGPGEPKEINVVTYFRPHATAVYDNQDKILEELNIKVNVIEMDVSDLYDKVSAAMIAESSEYDVVQFSTAWIGDYSRYLAPLNPLAERNEVQLSLDDVHPVFRDLYNTWDGTLYAMTWDGDAHIFYYNKDVFENTTLRAEFFALYGRQLAVPSTWEDYLQVASFLTRDWDNDGTMNYGTSELLKNGRSYYWWIDRFSAMGGVYFDENMTPLINSKSGVQALDNMIAAEASMPPEKFSSEWAQVRADIISGRVAMGKQWTDIGKAGELDPASLVNGKLGYALVPGWQWVDGVQRRPSLAGGWMLGIPKASAAQDEAIKFIGYITRKDVSLGIVKDAATALDPYRISHFESPEFASLWPSAGKYLEVIKDSLDVAFPDLGITHAADYMAALEVGIQAALHHEKTSQQALDDVAAQWVIITNQLGLESQKAEWNKQYDAMKASGISYRALP